MNLREKLSKIQQEIKAPKNLYNFFGKYKYRNAEGILEAFKPYEGKYNVALMLEDSITIVSDRIYVTATAKLLDTESDDVMQSAASAREPLLKKGMDDSQITGAASSYARKYALNGLLLLDDTKDADTDEYKTELEEKAKTVKAITKKEAALVKTLIEKHSNKGMKEEKILSTYGIKSFEDMTSDQYVDFNNKIKLYEEGK